MAKKNTNAQIPRTPRFETQALSPLANGMCPGSDGSMWLYRVVPQSNIVDAKSVDAGVNSGHPLQAMFEELANLPSTRLPNRRLGKGQYREVHVHAVNIPTLFRAQRGTATEEYLNRNFSNSTIIRRQVMFGIKMRPRTGNGAKGSMIESITETLFHGGSVLSDFDADYAELNSAFERCGFTVPTNDELALANGWWNHGQDAATPLMPHAEHLHFFRKPAAIQEARRHGIDQLTQEYIERHGAMPQGRDALIGVLEKFENDALNSCDSWPRIQNEFRVTFASVRDTHFGYLDITDPAALWAPQLFAAGARVISIRGLVEPARITAKELGSGKKAYNADLAEAAAKNKESGSEIEEKASELRVLENLYASGKAPATLMNASILIGFDGAVDDVSKLAPYGITLSSMVNRQNGALHETMICSSIKANPNQHDLPVTVVAFSGIQSLTQVGDKDGALLGFTEQDKQPAYLSPDAASGEDQEPLMLCAAATGAGKSLALLWMSYQFSMLGRPVVIIDPKQNSDHSAVVLAAGGRVASLDDLVQSDGILDPLRYHTDPQKGIQAAAAMISNVNPWGSSLARQENETDIINAITYGVMERGAKATGQALTYAVEDGVISATVTNPVFKVANSYPMFRATFGINPSAPPLSVADGITLFMVGSAQFDLPKASDQLNMSQASQLMRVSVNVIYQMVMGSTVALNGRGGVLQIDESWVVEKAAPDALDQIGRLSRSMNVLPVLYTQKPSGPLNAGLTGYFSRGLIGHISDKDEAEAGLNLFKSNTPGILHRVMEKGNTAAHNSNGAVNWDSLKALRDDDRKVLRGSVFYMSDLRGRIAPVEFVLPDEFLALSSTTPADVARRKAEQAAQGR